LPLGAILAKRGDMKNTTSSEYYFTDHKEKFLKDLGVLFASARKIFPRVVDSDEIPDIIEETRQGFGLLLPELPDLGGERNFFNASIIASVAALAYIRALEKREMPAEKINQSLYEIYFDAYSSLPRVIKMLLRWNEFSGKHLRQLKAFAEWTQARDHPENYVVEFVPGDGVNFDYGFNCTDCAVLQFYRRMDAEEHVPYICLGDFAASRALKTGLGRTTTLSNGAALCDFRYKKNQESLPGQRLEDLPEYKNRIMGS
jgi:hypothetical protein